VFISVHQWLILFLLRLCCSRSSVVNFLFLSRFLMDEVRMRKKLNADNSLFKIGLNIHQARRKRELTLGDIARHTGISKGLLSKIENFRTLPSLPVLAAIARSLNLKLENLVEGIGVEAKTAGQFVGVADRCRLKGKKRAVSITRR